MPALQNAGSLCRQRESWGKAIEYFQRLLNLYPDNGAVWAALGHCFLCADDLQSAYNAYQQALKCLNNPKDPKLWYGIGVLYDRYASFDYAEAAFASVLRIDPRFDKGNEVYFRIGIIYKLQQKYALALDCFKYILGCPPKPLSEGDVWFQIGHVHELQQEFNSARSAYETGLQRSPTNVKILLQLGWLYMQTAPGFLNYEQATSYLMRAAEIEPNDAQINYLLGRCNMARSKFNQAYENYQLAVLRDAKNPVFWCSIGVLYFELNQHRDALDAYSRAIYLNPNIPEIWCNLGKLYESCNSQTADAIDAYTKAVELEPSNHATKHRLNMLRAFHANAGPNPGAPEPAVHPALPDPSLYMPGSQGKAQPLSSSAYFPSTRTAQPAQPPPGPAQPTHVQPPVHQQPQIQPSMPSQYQQYDRRRGSFAASGPPMMPNSNNLPRGVSPHVNLQGHGQNLPNPPPHMYGQPPMQQYSQMPYPVQQQQYPPSSGQAGGMASPLLPNAQQTGSNSMYQSQAQQSVQSAVGQPPLPQPPAAMVSNVAEQPQFTKLEPTSGFPRASGSPSFQPGAMRAVTPSGSFNNQGAAQPSVPGSATKASPIVSPRIRIAIGGEDSGRNGASPLSRTPLRQASPPATVTGGVGLVPTASTIDGGALRAGVLPTTAPVRGESPTAAGTGQAVLGAPTSMEEVQREMPKMLRSVDDNYDDDEQQEDEEAGAVSAEVEDGEQVIRGAESVGGTTSSRMEGLVGAPNYGGGERDALMEEGEEEEEEIDEGGVVAPRT
ncbi:glucose repression mediator protein [Entophlyctis luteolus]|nr:glucose repression mediator protein [Entophlyctis luteolus]